MATTLTQFILAVRQRADMEESQFVSDAEITSYLNYSIQELYDILVATFEDYYFTSTDVVVAQGADTVTLPSDFYKLRGVDYKYSDTEYTYVQTFNFNERNHDRYLRYAYNESPVRYRLQGSSVKLMPSDSAPGTYRIWYIPKFTPLALAADSFDGINGWEEYAIVDAAMKCLAKEESSTTVLMTVKQGLLKRIENMAAGRDSGEPQRVLDREDSRDGYFSQRRIF